LSKIKADLEAADDNLDLLCSTALSDGIVFQCNYYSNPRKLIEDAYSEMHDSRIVKYFDIPEIVKLRSKYEDLSNETSREYNRLIAVTGNMSAKDGIALLKGLGFDTTRLESVKEVTALTVSIDASKLYFTREVIE
jgi:hypothetical protein